MAHDPNDFENYAPYLDSVVWPSRSAQEPIPVNREYMSPNQAASSLAKLVRWARVAPVGDITTLPDEDAREEEVRRSRLGQALAARACNLEEETFHAIYGEFGSRADADPHQVLAEIAVALGDAGLHDWTLADRIKIGSRLMQDLSRRFEIKEPLRRG